MCVICINTFKIVNTWPLFRIISKTFTKMEYVYRV